MAKGWTAFPGFEKKVNKREKSEQAAVAANRTAKQAIRTVSSLSYEKLKAEGDKLGDAKKAENASLIAAYEDKKLKSARLKKEARRLTAKKDKVNDRQASN